MAYTELQFIAVGRGPWNLSLVFYKPDTYCIHSMHASSQIQGWAQQLGVANSEDRGKADLGHLEVNNNSIYWEVRGRKLR